MPLTRKSEFKRDDYVYKSPDGDEYEITVVQTEDRKYVEIKREEDELQVQWDVEMLLDIADAVRAATQKRTNSKAHALRKPQVTDYRASDSKSPSESIQETVEESMKNLGASDATSAVESFSTGGDIENEIKERITRGQAGVSSESRIKRANVSTGDLF